MILSRYEIFTDFLPPPLLPGRPSPWLPYALHSRGPSRAVPVTPSTGQHHQPPPLPSSSHATHVPRGLVPLVPSLLLPPPPVLPSSLRMQLLTLSRLPFPAVIRGSVCPLVRPLPDGGAAVSGVHRARLAVWWGLLWVGERALSAGLHPAPWTGLVLSRSAAGRALAV